MTASASRLALAAIVMAALLFPGAAAADPLPYRNFGTQCTTSSLRACASVQAWNEINPATGALLLVVRVANVQGRAGFADLPAMGLGVWSIGGLAIDSWDDDAPSRSIADVVASVGIGNEGTLDCSWAGRCSSPATISAIETFATEEGDYNRAGDMPQFNSGAAIWGCDLPSDAIGLMTCEGQHITHTFYAHYTSGFRLTEQSSLRLAFYDSSWSSVECDTDPGASGLAGCATVAPEPITMILMGTGLLGIGGARARRRRRGAVQAE